MITNQRPADPLDLDKLTLDQWWKILKLKHVRAIGVALVAMITVVWGVAYWFGRSERDSDQQKQIAALEEQIAALNEAHRVALQEAQSETKKHLDEMRSRLRDGLPIADAPSTWGEFRGIKNLPGTWRGTFKDGPFVVDIEALHGEEMLAKFRSSATNCQATLKLVRATDDQLTTSNFFFKPTVATATCPDIESMMFRPFETFSDFRLTTTDGRSAEAKLIRKV